MKNGIMELLAEINKLLSLRDAMVSHYRSSVRAMAKLRYIRKNAVVREHCAISPQGNVLLTDVISRRTRRIREHAITGLSVTCILRV